MGNIRNRFPISVTIWEPRVNGVVRLPDKAGKFKNKQLGTFYKLKKKKIIIRPMEFETLMESSPNKRTVDLYMPSDDEVFPVKFYKGELKPIDVDQKQWLFRRLQLAHERWAKVGFFEKYGNLMAMIIFAFAALIMLYAVRQDFAKVIESLNAIVPALKNAVGSVNSPNF